MKPLHKITLAAAFTLLNATAQADLVVIAHPSNAESQVSLDTVRDIYLGKMTTFPGGGKLAAVDQKDGSPAKADFQAKVLRMNADQVKTYWSKLIFSGQGTPPRVMGNNAEVRGWVASNPNGIGYIDKASVDGSVKVLLTIP